MDAERSDDAVGAWCVYLIECRNGAWYAGITNDLPRRYRAHCSGRGARYTRANPPTRIVDARLCGDRSAALRAEAALKRVPRARKLAFLGGLGAPLALPTHASE